MRITSIAPPVTLGHGMSTVTTVVRRNNIDFFTGRCNSTRAPCSSFPAVNRRENVGAPTRPAYNLRTVPDGENKYVV